MYYLCWNLADNALQLDSIVKVAIVCLDSLFKGGGRCVFLIYFLWYTNDDDIWRSFSSINNIGFFFKESNCFFQYIVVALKPSNAVNLVFLYYFPPSFLQVH